MINCCDEPVFKEERDASRNTPILALYFHQTSRATLFPDQV
jgi:hypothetical protein